MRLSNAIGASLLLAGLQSTASASETDVATIDWYSIDCGTTTQSSTGPLQLHSTIGQPDASVAAGGGFTLHGGFWSAPIYRCPTDIDGSGDTGFNDLVLLLSQWGPCTECDDCPTDMTGDCVTGFDDVVLILSNWGPCVN